MAMGYIKKNTHTAGHDGRLAAIGYQVTDQGDRWSVQVNGFADPKTQVTVETIREAMAKGLAFTYACNGVVGLQAPRAIERIVRGASCLMMNKVVEAAAPEASIGLPDIMQLKASIK